RGEMVDFEMERPPDGQHVRHLRTVGAIGIKHEFSGAVHDFSEGSVLSRAETVSVRPKPRLAGRGGNAVVVTLASRDLESRRDLRLSGRKGYRDGSIGVLAVDVSRRGYGAASTEAVIVGEGLVVDRGVVGRGVVDIEAAEVDDHFPLRSRVRNS